MSSFNSLFKSDPKAEQDGVVVNLDVNENGDMMSITLAYAGARNLAFKKRVALALKPYAHLPPDSISDAVQTEAIQAIYADIVVKGWSHFTDDDGNELPFSPANCRKLFASLPKLWEYVVTLATNDAMFNSSILEAEAKN